MTKNNLIHNLTDHYNVTNRYPLHGPHVTGFDVKRTIKYLRVRLNLYCTYICVNCHLYIMR